MKRTNDAKDTKEVTPGPRGQHPIASMLKYYWLIAPFYFDKKDALTQALLDDNIDNMRLLIDNGVRPSKKQCNDALAFSSRNALSVRFTDFHLAMLLLNSEPKCRETYEGFISAAFKVAIRKKRSEHTSALMEAGYEPFDADLAVTILTLKEALSVHSMPDAYALIDIIKQLSSRGFKASVAHVYPTLEIVARVTHYDHMIPAIMNACEDLSALLEHVKMQLDSKTFKENSYEHQSHTKMIKLLEKEVKKDTVVEADI